MALAYALQSHRGARTRANSPTTANTSLSIRRRYEAQIHEDTRLELLSWCRTLERKLRLQQRRPRRLEPELAFTASQRARLAARRDRSAVREASDGTSEGSVGRPRRLHQRHSRSSRTSARRISRAARFARTARSDEQGRVLKLMEIQRHAMLMYTSCGWFFNELSGIETVQVIQYAGRAIQLSQDVLGRDFEEGFLKLLEHAQSNIHEHGNGRSIYNKFVKPAMISWDNVVAHYAISSLFSSYQESTKVFLYSFEEQHRKLLTAGKARLAVGTTRVWFEITRESRFFTYAALYLGEHHVTAAVRPLSKRRRPTLKSLRNSVKVSTAPIFLKPFA